MDNNHILFILLLVLGPFFAIAAGKARTERMRQLREDLQHGRLRGFAVLGMAVVLFFVFQYLNGKS